MHKEDLNYFKKKKNITLFVLSFSFSLLLTAIILILALDQLNNELVVTIYFVGLILYIFLFIYLRSKLILYTMNYFYQLMISENLGLISVERRLYTESWLNTFINDGYKKYYENNDYIIYYQFHKKLSNLGKTGYVLVMFIVAKNEDFDFYENNVNIQVERLYDGYEYEHRVKKQIIIQFKKYDNFDLEHKNKLQEIINYKTGEQVLINLPVGYFVRENQVYYLRPSKRYFNKYHFYATGLAAKYSNVKGE